MDKKNLIFVIGAFICFALNMVEALCPNECSCIYQPTSCPLGVRLAKDGCNCCNVCTRQYGEYCDEQNICDSEMGLVCDFGAAPGPRGICKVQIAQSCSFNGQKYLNGEMFHPTCKHRCWCMDGAVGCLSLCPHETRVPMASACPDATLKVVDGECCKRWFCGRDENARMLPLEQFWDKYVDKEIGEGSSEATIPEDTVSTLTKPGRNSLAGDRRVAILQENAIPDTMENFLSYDESLGDEEDDFVDYDDITTLLVHRGGHARMGSTLPGYDSNNVENRIREEENSRRRRPNPRTSCAVQTTSWSSCSKTCGLGIATRVTNNNRDCELRRESRLCKIRPCDDESYAAPKKGKRCLRHKRERKRTYIRYSNCKSIRSFKARYCGGCDDGRCCTPHSTRTVKIRFRCENGEDLVKNMMMIRTCRCHNNCSPLTANSFVVSRDLHADMHKPTAA